MFIACRGILVKHLAAKTEVPEAQFRATDDVWSSSWRAARENRQLAAGSGPLEALHLADAHIALWPELICRWRPSGARAAAAITRAARAGHDFAGWLTWLREMLALNAAGDENHE